MVGIFWGIQFKKVNFPRFLEKRVEQIHAELIFEHSEASQRYGDMETILCKGPAFRDMN